MRARAEFRRRYGASPLHLLALLACLLVAGAGIAGWLDATAPFTDRVLVWFIGAAIGHDLVLLPLYSLLDRIAFGAWRHRGAARAEDPGAGWAFVRIPALLSGLLLLIFFPEILRLGDQTFHTASGMHQNVYLVRYLLTCAALFAGSAFVYGAGAIRSRRAARPVRSARAPRTGQTGDD
jgi:hypothetical protein